MNRLNLTIGLIAILTIISCSRSKLTELSLNCGCIATEHYIASTRNTENSTKKYTFKNSQLFDLGVSKDGFANSFAFQVCKLIDNTDKFDLIEINILKETNGEIQSSKSYTYELEKIKKELPKYLQLESFVSEYVVNIYNKNYTGCLEFVDFDDEEKFKAIIDNIYEDLNKDYRDTRIVDYKPKGDSCLIYGIIKSKSDQLDLFTMKLKEVDDNYKIISFHF